MTPRIKDKTISMVHKNLLVLRPASFLSRILCYGHTPFTCPQKERIPYPPQDLCTTSFLEVFLMLDHSLGLSSSPQSCWSLSLCSYDSYPDCNFMLTSRYFLFRFCSYVAPQFTSRSSEKRGRIRLQLLFTVKLFPASNKVQNKYSKNTV